MKSLRSDIYWTIVAQGAVAAALFLQYRIVRQQWGVEALSSYSIVFRARGALEWIILLVLPLATARQLSMTEERKLKWGLSFTSMLSGAFLLVFFSASCLFFKNTASFLMFGTVNLVPWVLPFCSLLISYGFFLLVSGVLRGFFEFRIANGINVISIAVVPTICLMAGGSFILVDVVFYMGIFSVLTTTILFLVYLAIQKPEFCSLKKERFSRDLKSLLSYGSPRLLTLAGSALFIMFLPWLLSMHGETNILAALNSMMAIVSASAMLTAPTGFVLLPHFSRSIAAGDKDEAALLLGKIIDFTCFIGLAGSIMSLGFLDDVMVFWLGNNFSKFTVMLIATSLIVPAFLLIDVLRNPIDAASSIPWNAFTYLVGFFVSALTYVVLIVSRVVNLEIICSISLVAGFGFAAVTCLITASILYGLRQKIKNIYIFVLIWVLAIILHVFAIDYRLSSQLINAISIGLLIFLAASVIFAKPTWYQMIFGLKRKK